MSRAMCSLLLRGSPAVPSLHPQPSPLEMDPNPSVSLQKSKRFSLWVNKGAGDKQPREPPGLQTGCFLLSGAGTPTGLGVTGVCCPFLSMDQALGDPGPLRNLPPALRKHGNPLTAPCPHRLLSSHPVFESWSQAGTQVRPSLPHHIPHCKEPVQPTDCDRCSPGQPFGSCHSGDPLLETGHPQGIPRGP